jgi:hypothetical protein
LRPDEIDKAWVPQTLIENVEICMGRRKARGSVIRGGQICGAEQYQPNPTAANRGLELLGRRFRLWSNRQWRRLFPGLMGAAPKPSE